MSDPIHGDLSGFSLLDLFRSEAATQTGILSEGLLQLERDPGNLGRIEALMRAAHSIKGAAAIVDLPQVVLLAHQMEDAFVAAQQGKLQLGRGSVDRLLAGVDLLEQVARLTDADAPAWFDTQASTIATVAKAIAACIAGADAPVDSAAAAGVPVPEPEPRPATPVAPAVPTAASPAAGPRPGDTGSERRGVERGEQSLKVDVAHLDRLLTLTSQSLVSAHRLSPMLQAMQRFKKRQAELFALVDDLQQQLAPLQIPDLLKEKALAITQMAAPLKHDLLQRLTDLETHERTVLVASQTTLDEVLGLRMRPFRDGVHALPRMVRDLSRSLGKEVRLDIIGESTLVDRDVLARIESPISQLLRNSIDHGMEPPAQRHAAGKSREGVITLTARHAGGMLHVEVVDDGQGVDLERIRRKIVERQMATEAMAASLSSAELLEFLFLPAFSLKEGTSLVSGRGVGLDIVHETIRQQSGTVTLESDFGRGMKTCIVLPLTQSVVRTLVVTIGGEAYAVPIARIERVLQVAPDAMHLLEDKPFFTVDGEHVGLVEAAQVLGLPARTGVLATLPVILLGSGNRRYGLLVDAILAEHSLAVQTLEPIFGKTRDIAAGALLDDGTPVLLLDVADLLLSMEKLLGNGRLQALHANIGTPQKAVRRILVVDDSLTVREMERNLLLSRGFAVDVAVDGIDGWNAVRSARYDLLITDVDMPRMDGIELVTLVKKDPRLQALPVMIVSYKDRPEDRARGIQAGADYYLTKGSFHDATLLDAVTDLIGEAQP